MRNISSDFADEFTQPSVAPALLAELYFEGGTLRMWTGFGDLIWNGETFTGGGNFITISAIEETQELVAKGIVCSLNGVPTSNIALALSERPRGRPFRLYLGIITSRGHIAKEDDDGVIELEDGSGFIQLENGLFDTPYRIFSGLMDVIEITDNGDDCILRLSVESILITGQRTKLSRYTDNDQKKLYSSDDGLNLVNQLQDKQLVW